MNENLRTMSESREDALQRRVAAAEARKLKAKRQGVQGLWMGLGMFGLVGWAVAIPTFLGCSACISTVIFPASIRGLYPY
jgi:ATP synthase protein I